MAISTQDLAESLTQDEIPIKLRCASCNKLVVNAFRLPCCDQNICENCQTSLPESCPVCMHSPLSADDCKPNKALRLTVKAFLKSEEKKRDKAEAAIATPITPAPQLEAVPVLSAVIAPTSTAVAQSIENTPAPSAIKSPTTNTAEEVQNFNPSEHIPEDPSLSEDATKVPRDYVAPKEAAGQGPHDANESNTSQTKAQPQEQGQSVTWAAINDQTQPQVPNIGYGYNGANNFAQQNWTGAYNPMMLMQGGLNNTMWPAFPNQMGMPAMGFDPMMMAQGMYGGFNGQGMNGMNGMNMGMGFDGGMSGWGGQGQMGMEGMNGSFGANSGYYPTGGYNQPSHQGRFNQMQQPQFSMHNPKQTRFRGQGNFHRGQGRGMPHGYGRGQTFEGMQNSVHPSMQGRQWSQRDESIVESIEQQHAENGNDHALAEVTEVSDVKVSTDTLDANEHAELQGEQAGTSHKNDENQDTIRDEPHAEHLEDMEESMLAQLRPGGSTDDDIMLDDTPLKQDEPQAIATVDTTDMVEDISPAEIPFADTDFVPVLPPQGPAIPLGPAAQFTVASTPGFHPRGRGAMRMFGRGGVGRGMMRGRGMDRMMPPPSRYGASFQDAQVTASVQAPVASGVIGAPKGPKAMRDGLPNIGFRGRGGFQITGRGAKTNVVQSQVLNGGHDHASEHSPEQRQQSKSPIRSPSRSRTPSDRHREHRHRSTSVSEHNKRDDYDAERDHERRHSKKRRRSRRHEEAESRNDDDLVIDLDLDGARAALEDANETTHRHSRASSPGSKHHRSTNRERERDRDRDREKHRSSRHDLSHSRERRKRRHRSKSIETDRATDRYADEVYEEPEAIRNGTGGHSKSHNQTHHEPKRSDHRERHRDREREDERERDKQDDRSYGKERNRERKRSRREDDEEQARKHDKPDDVEQDRHRRDHERDYRKSSSTKTIENQPPSILSKSSQPTTQTFAPPTGPREFKIKDRSKRRDENPDIDGYARSKTQSIPQTPEVDPHTLEREARNRERMARELQRRGLAPAAANGVGNDIGTAIRKRGFEDISGDFSKRKHHRGSGKRSGASGTALHGYDYTDEEGSEERAARVEREREAVRWM